MWVYTCDKNEESPATFDHPTYEAAVMSLEFHNVNSDCDVEHDIFDNGIDSREGDQKSVNYERDEDVPAPQPDEVVLTTPGEEEPLATLTVEDEETPGNDEPTPFGQ